MELIEIVWVPLLLFVVFFSVYTIRMVKKAQKRSIFLKLTFSLEAILSVAVLLSLLLLVGFDALGVGSRYFLIEWTFITGLCYLYILFWVPLVLGFSFFIYEKRNNILKQGTAKKGLWLLLSPVIWLLRFLIYFGIWTGFDFQLF